MSLEALGAELRKAREKQKITLERIAAETRISIRHLADLEQGSYDRLPGGMYNRAFLRSYCATIGLDPNPILERYEAALAPGDGPAKQKFRAEASVEYGRRVSPLIVWSGMLALSIVGLTSSRDWIAGSLSPYFSRRAPPAPAHTGASAEPRRTRPSETNVAVAAPARSNDPPGEASSPAPPPSQSASLRLDLEVVTPCWVRLQSDGNPVLLKVLEPGDRQSFEAVESFSLKLGNAGGLRARLNGRPARTFGAPGKIATVLVDRRNLEDFFDPASR